ncbi:hypothetical protein Bt4C1_29455 (plasmid) [Bacillus thuringiensis serovar alesti]|nr:hypothetical protein Bt4C1_29455 [Bacillus thuringiensis serovar alesti]OTY39857.1 hypothetical protein BK745_14295 [Bacillus thuringiensis serovar alesti]
METPICILQYAGTFSINQTKLLEALLMNLKKYINNKFMVYCFEIGFESAIARVQQELQEVNLNHFIYQDLFLCDPESIAKKTEEVTNTYHALLNRNTEQWFFIYRAKTLDFHSAKKLFKQLEELRLQSQH